MAKIPNGRGARSNRSSRFLDISREAFHDGWSELDADVPKLRTVLQPMRSKTIIARNDSPDISFAQSINPYRGCEHGCIYCYARPAHAYLGLSPGLDFESRLFFKPEAGELLSKALSRKSYRPNTIHIGGDTDPYQPIERQLRITRDVISTLARFRHPFSIISKSNLILRDLDLLGPLGRENLVHAAISITTLDRSLARSMEPRAPTPQRRLDAVRGLSSAGVPTVVMFAPVIPGLNDHELENVVEAAAQAGAVSAGYVMVRLPLEISDLFQEWLNTDHPGRAAKVMSLIRQMRDGRDYVSAFGERMKGAGPIAGLVAARFKAAKRRYGLTDWPSPLDLSQFRPPAEAGDQLDLWRRPSR